MFINIIYQSLYFHIWLLQNVYACSRVQRTFKISAQNSVNWAVTQRAIATAGTIDPIIHQDLGPVSTRKVRIHGEGDDGGGFSFFLFNLPIG